LEDLEPKAYLEPKAHMKPSAQLEPGAQLEPNGKTRGIIGPTVEQLVAGCSTHRASVSLDCTWNERTYGAGTNIFHPSLALQSR